ncbi:DUF2334 domain-containing protein [Salibacterium aidingense]|uniref:DUF2334 domain-containing protein n=1 Tax=Salibacterium aidingense TaxID=384933 RepID=UPI003BE7768C
MKILLKTFIVFLLLAGSLLPYAESRVSAEEDEASVLVLYSSKDKTVDADQRLLDMAIGAFTDSITFKDAETVTVEDIEGVTHLFYYGKVQDTLSSNVREVMDTFSGPVMALGKNVEQLGNGFDFVKSAHCQTITALSMPGQPDKAMTIEPEEVDGIEIDEETEVLVQGENKTGTYPIMVKRENHYYYDSDSLVPPFSMYFSQVLYDVFDIDTPAGNPAYIRLEDIHPLADPEQLMAVAEILKEKEIPYMMAVIPVYTDPETGEEMHFNDAPEVLKALRYMQKNGGSVILHGYTHQYRDSETGEGFEFWDVENDRPIYQGQEEEADLRRLEDFESKEAFEEFTEENKAFERDYIEKRVTRGIQELANFGLYPLAFEAPHYTMSQNGYEVVSEYFSTYVGQLQLHDKDWRTMETTPIPSKPSFLHGMQLLPETLGYVKPEDDKAVERMMKQADQYQITDGGMTGGFYHPYLGVERFEDLIEGMEQIPDVQWIDLKEMKNVTTAENVEITSGDGTIETDINQRGLMMTSMDFPVYHIKVAAEKSMWGIAGIGMSGVVLFGAYMTVQRSSRKRMRGEK